MEEEKKVEAPAVAEPKVEKAPEVAPTPVEEAGLPFTKSEQPVEKPGASEIPTTISIPTLGNNSADNPQPELSERERAMKLFKV